jgi:hypothetical protein
MDKLPAIAVGIPAAATATALAQTGPPPPGLFFREDRNEREPFE